MIVFRLWRSEKRIEERLAAYLQQVMGSLNRLKETFPACLDGTYAQEGDLSNPVHEFESAADDLRRELELELYSGRLLPQSRADLLALIEAIDSIPNTAENIVDFFSIQRLIVDPALGGEVEQLLLKGLEACAAMSETVRLLFSDLEPIRELAAEVDRLESECDTLERRLIRRVFDLDLELAHKLHLRDFVFALGTLADRAENVADMVRWMAVKRRP
jgi:predicted phosphate transport protein (TIGR00153 family)